MRQTAISDDRPLFVSDLDGTLLGADSRVSRRSAALLSGLTASGALITAATARTPATAHALLQPAGIRIPEVVMTGAALWNPLTMRYEAPSFIDPDVRDAVKLLMERHGLRPFEYTLDEGAGMLHTYYNGVMTRREKAFADERSHLPLKRLHFDYPADLLPRGTTLMFFTMADRERIFACADDIRSRIDGCSLSAYNDIYNRDMGLLEVFAAGVTKASAIRSLAQRFDATSVTVFGDNLNDIPMMQAADHAVAVANAAPEVKAVAHEIIGPNTADSVALYIAERLSVR